MWKKVAFSVLFVFKMWLWPRTCGSVVRKAQKSSINSRLLLLLKLVIPLFLLNAFVRSYTWFEVVPLLPFECVSWWWQAAKNIPGKPIRQRLVIRSPRAVLVASRTAAVTSFNHSVVLIQGLLWKLYERNPTSDWFKSYWSSRCVLRLTDESMTSVMMPTTVIITINPSTALKADV